MKPAHTNILEMSHEDVAIALTVYGIETEIKYDLLLMRRSQVAIALTVYGIETARDTDSVCARVVFVAIALTVYGIETDIVQHGTMWTVFGLQ